MRELHRPDDSFRKLFSEQTPRPGIFYVPSQFALPFSHRGKQYIFNTLTKQCIKASLPECATAGEEYNELIKTRFLVPEGTDEFSFYRSVVTLLKLQDRKNRKPAYTILPTLGCNARCVYCFQQGMEQIGMTSETVEDTLRFILNDCGGKRITLSWFGGEPLLREDVIDRIAAGVREAGIEYKSLMVSNGSLITPEMIRKMTDLWKLESILVSMDGAEEDYIARKRYLRYRDDYHTVIDAVDRMSEAGISVHVRCNVDEENIARIPRFLEDLSGRIADRKNIVVQFVPLYQVLRRDNGHGIWTGILALREKAIEAGLDSPFEYFNRQMPVIHCMADAGGIVIAPNGDLHCCEDLPKGSRIGTVKNGVTEQKVRADFVSMCKLPEKCKACAFLPDCMPIVDCPKNGLICIEGRTFLTLAVLRRLIDQAEKEE